MIRDSRGDNSTGDLDSDDVIISTPFSTKVATLFIASFGIVANSFVILTIASYVPLRKRLTNTFIANQSAIDTVAAVFLLFTTLFEDRGTARTPGNTLDEFVCRVWYAKLPLWGLLLSSTYGVVAMSLEKYLAVVHPIWYASKFTRRRWAIAGLLAAPWVLGLAILIGYAVPTSVVTGWGACTTYSVWPNRRTQLAVGVTIFGLQYFIPFSGLVYLYACMAAAVHRRVSPTANIDHKGAPSGSAAGPAAPRRNETMAKARGNIIKTLATVSVFYVLFWSSNQWYFVLYNAGAVPMEAGSAFYSATVILVFLNCCVNPVVYGVRYKQFQNGVAYLFTRRRTCDTNTSVIPAITKNDVTNDDDA